MPAPILISKVSSLAPTYPRDDTGPMRRIAGDQEPPLPAGIYQASLNVDDGFAAAPPSIPVHVTRVTRP